MRPLHSTAVLVMSLAAAPLAMGSGDTCSNPYSLSGAVLVGYDPAMWATDPLLMVDPNQCFPDGNTNFDNDMWICWTADCTGQVTISMCNFPPGGGTRLAMWSGCLCPLGGPAGAVPPLCCNDSFCGSHAQIVCDVVCDQQYLIRVGTDPGASPLSGTLSIVCNGRPCDSLQADPNGPGTVCGTCCQGVPSVTGYSKPIMLSTDYSFDPNGGGGDPAKRVVRVFEIGSPPAAPAIWTTVPRFDMASWNIGTVGTVFGVTVDDVGNIYLAHTAIFFSNETGSLGGSTGAVTMINGATGAPSLLVNLPNSANGPGLGNLTWSCGRKNLYVTNFEDGRIYRVDPAAPAASRIKSAWDFATDTLDTSGGAEAGDPVGIAPYGERVWAVADGGDRLFFSVWNSDSGAPANTIWSVQLNGSGDPIAGTKTIEIVQNQATIRRAPVSDIAIDAECCLYTAQRTMSGMSTGAHGSDLLKYCWDPAAGAAGAWVLGPTFLVGDSPWLDHSCAGGVGVDDGANGLVWTTGDALELTNFAVYGVAGIPQTGGDETNSILIDNDNDIVQGDKTQQGSCEVVCTLTPSEPCTVDVDSVSCVLGSDGFPTGEYSVVLTIHNNSGVAANLLLLPTLGMFQWLDPPLQSGQSLTLKVVVTGMPGEIISIPMGLYDGAVNCCGVKAEVELPECECALFTDVHVECISDGNPNTYTYTVSFTVHNISQNPSFTATWLFLTPPSGSGYSFTPTVVNVFPLPAGGQTGVGPLTLTFTGPPPAGWRLHVPVSIHNANLGICCSTELWLQGPTPCPPSCSADLNGDGAVNGADLALLLGAWGSSSGGCADLNGDGTVNGADLAVMLGAWG